MANVFDKTKQKLKEMLGRADRTNYDKAFIAELTKAEQTSDHVKKTIRDIAAYVQPDPSVRTSTSLQKLALSPAQKLGTCLNEAEGSFKNTKFGTSLAAVASSLYEFDGVERFHIKKVEKEVLQPMQKFMDNEHKNLITERGTLGKKRQEMDTLKNKLLDTNKEKAVEKLEPIVEKSTYEFQKQAETVTTMLKKYPEHHERLRQNIKKLIEADVEYHKNAIEAFKKCLSKF